MKWQIQVEARFVGIYGLDYRAKTREVRDGVQRVELESSGVGTRSEPAVGSAPLWQVVNVERRR